jgi:hypothetical protein
VVLGFEDRTYGTVIVALNVRFWAHLDVRSTRRQWLELAESGMSGFGREEAVSDIGRPKTFAVHPGDSQVPLLEQSGALLDARPIELHKIYGKDRYIQLMTQSQYPFLERGLRSKQPEEHTTR